MTDKSKPDAPLSPFSAARRLQAAYDRIRRIVGEGPTLERFVEEDCRFSQACVEYLPLVLPHPGILGWQAIELAEPYKLTGENVLCLYKGAPRFDPPTGFVLVHRWAAPNGFMAHWCDGHRSFPGPDPVAFMPLPVHDARDFA